MKWNCLFIEVLNFVESILILKRFTHFKNMFWKILHGYILNVWSIFYHRRFVLIMNMFLKKYNDCQTEKRMHLYLQARTCGHHNSRWKCTAQWENRWNVDRAGPCKLGFFFIFKVDTQNMYAPLTNYFKRCVMLMLHEWHALKFECIKYELSWRSQILFVALISNLYKQICNKGLIIR